MLEREPRRGYLAVARIERSEPAVGNAARLNRYGTLPARSSAPRGEQRVPMARARSSPSRLRRARARSTPRARAQSCATISAAISSSVASALLSPASLTERGIP